MKYPRPSAHLFQRAEAAVRYVAAREAQLRQDRLIEELRLAVKSAKRQQLAELDRIFALKDNRRPA